MPEELTERVQQWLIDGHNAKEKEAALWRVFTQMMGGEDPGMVDPEEFDYGLDLKMKETVQ